MFTLSVLKIVCNCYPGNVNVTIKTMKMFVIYIIIWQYLCVDISAYELTSKMDEPYNFTLFNYTQQVVTNNTLFAQFLWNKFSGSDGIMNITEMSLLLSTGRSQQNGSAFINYGSGRYCFKDDSNEICVDTKFCTDAQDIFKINNVETEISNFTDFMSLLPSVLFAFQQPGCDTSSSDTEPKHYHRPPKSQVWGFGFLCVTLINLCSLFGLLFLPMNKKRFYKKFLMFMVALGVGTLTGSSLLFLLPECFELTHEDSPQKEDYIWKSTAVLGGIYLFFLTERLLQRISEIRKETDLHLDNVGSIKIKARTRHDSESIKVSFALPDAIAASPNIVSGRSMPNSTTSESRISQSPLIKDSSINDCPTDISNDHRSFGDHSKSYSDKSLSIANKSSHGHIQELNHGHSHGHTHIKNVAWMVIFGDGLHNFIDGLSIGAAFAGNIYAGISVSLAVLCEELPHELGDFAILLNSGMKVKQALMYNFLSACMCYLGLICGVLIGEMTAGSTWIFAIAGGMFLYISLVDMFPEVNHAAQEEVKYHGHAGVVFLIQNLGMITGYSIMLILALYTGKINIGE